MALTPEQVKIVNLESIVEALTRKLDETEKDLKSLQTAHSLKGRRIIELEAEVVRLRMLRTDEQLRGEVDGLREQVSSKDKTIDRLQKNAVKLAQAELDSIARVRKAEQRTEHFQATLETMQHARDEAQENLAVAKREFEAAVVAKDQAGRLWAEADALSKSLEKIREQAVKAVRALPPIARKSKEVRTLAALLKEPEPVAAVEEKKEAVK